MKRIWITATGDKIRIRKLSDKHLINIYKMIARARHKALHSAYMLSTILTGEIAQDSISQEIDNLEEMDDYDYVDSVAPEISNEVIRRDLLKLT